MRKANKPRWKTLNRWERIAREAKQMGYRDVVVDYFREKAEKEKQVVANSEE